METFNDSLWMREAGGPSAPPHVPPQALSVTLDRIARAFRSKPFEPHPLARGGHAQTLAAALRRSRQRDLRREHRGYDSRLVEVEPGVRVLLKCRWQEARREAPTLLLAHGLEGSSESPYILSTARKAFRRGFNVACLNMRSCGGTEHLTHTLYHSGLTGDIHRVITELAERDGLTRVFLAGFSMSGNMALKLAGDYGGGAPRSLAGVCAVSPSLDLSACADYIERRGNWIYMQSFMRSLRGRIRRQRERHPHLYDTRGLRRVRTVRQFDERFTAPHGGYRDAADYYARASSLPVIPDIRVPTLILHADDDPIIPAGPLRSRSIADNPDVLLVVTPRGGHVGFIADARGDEDHFWAENRVLEFCGMLARGGGGGGA